MTEAPNSLPWKLAFALAHPCPTGGELYPEAHFGLVIELPHGQTLYASGHVSVDADPETLARVGDPCWHASLAFHPSQEVVAPIPIRRWGAAMAATARGKLLWVLEGMGQPVYGGDLGWWLLGTATLHLRRRITPDELARMGKEPAMSPWGSYRGRERLPCPEDPLLLAGKPIGQYHCPGCGEMQLAGMPHMPPDPDYELVTGYDWPPGYQDVKETIS